MINIANSLPTVFIGSSSEGLNVALAIRDRLTVSSDVTVWHEGVFGLGDGTLEALVAAAHRFDFAVLVLTPDDLVTSRRRRQQSPRDNVLFECGLFMGTLGRHRTFVVYDKRHPLKTPSDLAGVTMASFGDAASVADLGEQVRPASEQIASAIVKLGRVRPPPSPFWEPFLSPNCRIVLGGFPGFNDFEASGVLGVGDAICLTEVSSSLRARYNCDPPVRYAKRLDGDEVGMDLITIGGPDANTLTRDTLPRLPTTLKFGDPNRNEVAFYSSVTQTQFVPQRNDNGDVVTDYGIILRTPNPLASGRHVVALFGCFGFGTWAAGRYTTSETFLADRLVASGANLECIVRTEIVRNVPQQAVVCEIREIATTSAGV